MEYRYEFIKKTKLIIRRNFRKKTLVIIILFEIQLGNKTKFMTIHSRQKLYWV